MKIIIPGEPIPQGRMRYRRIGNFISTYDPNAKHKKLVREILEAKKTLLSFEHPRISVLFHMPIPKSIRKKDIALYNSEKLKHDKKPDVDNLLKLLLDCLDGIIIQGDQKVSLGPCMKIYSPEPKTIIWIYETSRIASLWELDFAFCDAQESEISTFFEKDCPFDCDTPIPPSLLRYLRTINLPPEAAP